MRPKFLSQDKIYLYRYQKYNYLQTKFSRMDNPIKITREIDKISPFRQQTTIFCHSIWKGLASKHLRASILQESAALPYCISQI